MTDARVDYSDQCPACGAFYTLSSHPPHPPAMLVEYGDDEDLDAWEDEHDYEITECMSCGWRDDE